MRVAGRAGEKARELAMMARGPSHWHMIILRLELSISPGEGVTIELRKYANMRKPRNLGFIRIIILFAAFNYFFYQKDNSFIKKTIFFIKQQIVEN